MKNRALESIKQTVQGAFVALYGYCGLADGDDFAMLNSGGEGENFIVTIKDESNPKPPKSKPELKSVTQQKNIWRVHTPGLLKEIVNCSGNAIYEKPLNIFGKILATVGERAAEINDPKLNALMCQLTIYEIADPHHPNHDPEKTDELLEILRR